MEIGCKVDEKNGWKFNEWRRGWIMLEWLMKVETRWLKNLNGRWINESHK
jgi:hypothetical protein